MRMQDQWHRKGGYVLFIELMEESLKYERWRDNFKELGEKMEFLLFYGSILNSPNEANDIDVIGVFGDDAKYNGIDSILRKIQLSQVKKIHFIDFKEKGFKEELKRKNKAFI